MTKARPGLSAAIALCTALSVLGACGESPGTAPGAVSEGEARALEEAAEMLDERRLPKGALPETSQPGSPVSDGQTSQDPASED